MGLEIEDLIERVTKLIVESVDPQRIILFGSHAYGHPTSDSDVDLLIIEEAKATVKAMKEVRRFVGGLLKVA